MISNFFIYENCMISIFVSTRGLKIAILAILGQLTAEIFRGDFIRLRNCSKLVEGSLFTIISLLLEAKSITLYFIWCVG